MIHIVTIHWKTDKWIDIQLKYLKHFIKEPFKVYAFLNYIKNSEKHINKYEYVSQEPIKSHPIKLNLLADIAQFNSDSDNDYLIFLDGDAFPIEEFTVIKNTLNDYPLAAVQRYENYGDQQPHPCFCITTIGFWKTIQGDWKKGSYCWLDSLGNQVGDVGGELLNTLNSRKIRWNKLLRSNNVEQNHPLLFGCYEEMIYHHGAGFRSAIMRSDSNTVKFYRIKKTVFNCVKFFSKEFALKYFAPYRKLKQQNNDLSNKMYNQIQSDFYFFEKM